MSKFFITNSLYVYESLKANIQNSRFKLSFDYSETPIYALATHKLCVDNENAFQVLNNFVITTGTIIYKDSLTFNHIIEDYKNVVNIRNNSVGQYAVTLKKENTIFVFGDAFGAFDIYYYNRDGMFLITNSLFDLACVLSDKITINKYNVVESVCQYAILNNETIFNEVSRLPGNQYVEIDLDSVSMKQCQVPVHYPLYNSDSISKSVMNIAEHIHNCASQYHKAFGEPNICITGGLDSRTSLAAFLSVNAHPTLYFGKGNGTPQTKGDEYVNQQFAGRYNLEYSIEDWPMSNPIDKDWERGLAVDYGFLGSIYGASNGTLSSFEHMKGIFTTCGYGGELYRNLEWLEYSYIHRMTLDKFIDQFYISYYRNNARFLTKQISDYRDYIRNKLLKICDYYNLNYNNLCKEDITLFMMEYRKIADTTVLQFLNQMKYSGFLLMENTCIQSARLPYDSIRYSSLMIRVMRELFPDILSIPVYSHGELLNLQDGNMFFEPNIKEHIKYLIPAIIKEPAKRWMRKRQNSEIGSYIFDKLKKNDFLFDVNLEGSGKLEYYTGVRLLYYLMCFKKLNISIFS